jgi:benzoyl-CoA reductase/2-hydroxyglutaryl-CoA dehydratase subunit BcrC/BadD/HgdB
LAQATAQVELNLKKEAVLEKVYGVEITSEAVDTEVARINRSTRAPEMLAELKSALGGDPARFANSMARPIVVERELRRR